MAFFLNRKYGKSGLERINGIHGMSYTKIRKDFNILAYPIDCRQCQRALFWFFLIEDAAKLRKPVA